VHGFASAGEIVRALPRADILEDRAVLCGPVMDWRAAHRIEQIAPSRARERAERHRRIRHAERGEPNLRYRRAGNLRHDHERIHVRGLALIGRHPGCGVTLDVLDRTEALAQCDRQILGRDVVLKVDEGRLPAAAARDSTGCTARRCFDCRHVEGARYNSPVSCGACCGFTLRIAIRQRGLQAENAAAGSG